MERGNRVQSREVEAILGRIEEEIIRGSVHYCIIGGPEGFYLVNVSKASIKLNVERLWVLLRSGDRTVGHEALIDRPDIVVSLAFLICADIARLKEILCTHLREERGRLGGKGERQNGKNGKELLSHQEGSVAGRSQTFLGSGICLCCPSPPILISCSGGFLHICHMRHPNVNRRS